MELLEVQKICKSFEQRNVLNNLELSLSSGNLYLLKGPNGSGKTTFLKIICGLILPDQGTIRFRGQELSKKNLPSDLISYIPNDERSFFLRLTVRENLNFFLRLIGRPVESADTLINKILIDLNHSDLLDKRMSSLSRGQLMIVSLIRGFMINPKIILIDEALDSLDVEIRSYFISFLENYLLEKEAISIIVSHNNILKNSDISEITFS